MEEKTVALAILGVVVIIAVVGLILVVPANAKAHQEYPGGVYSPAAVTQYPKGIGYAERPLLEVEETMPVYEAPSYPTVNAR